MPWCAFLFLVIFPNGCDCKGIPSQIALNSGLGMVASNLHWWWNLVALSSGFWYPRVLGSVFVFNFVCCPLQKMFGGDCNPKSGDIPKRYLFCFCWRWFVLKSLKVRWRFQKHDDWHGPDLGCRPGWWDSFANRCVSKNYLHCEQIQLCGFTNVYMMFKIHTMHMCISVALYLYVQAWHIYYGCVCVFVTEYVYVYIVVRVKL